jgi:hypothetical protein
VLKIFNLPITVSKNAVLRLDEHEKNNVSDFLNLNRISFYPIKILFECAPASGQSSVNYEFAIQVAENVAARNKNVCFILSGAFNSHIENPQIFNASAISFRENLELINNCDLLVGCSSGITWLTICESAKPIPSIQLLSQDSDLFAGVHFDFEINKIDNSHIIELIDFDVNKTIDCIESALQNGIFQTKLKFHQVYKPSIFNLKNNIMKLVWLKFSLKELINYVESFLNENKFLNNEI